MGAELFSGIPVAVNPERIEKEISNLWKGQRGGPPAGGRPAPEDSLAGTAVHSPLTHTCLSNLVFHLPDARSCEKARQVLPGVGRHFPSRIFLLTEGETSDRDEPLAAWVDAICHLPSRGAPPLCCEQITIESRGGSLELFPGAVVPLLVPDVPVILVFLSAGGERLLDLFPGTVDRVVFDSRDLGLPGLCRPRDLLETEPALEVDDLAWRDILGWRRVLSDLFDDPKARSLLQAINAIEVEYVEAPEGRAQNPSGGAAGPGASGAPGAGRAALLGGWLASRLGVEAPAADAGEETPLSRVLGNEGRTLRLSLVRSGTARLGPGQIGRVEISADVGGKRCFLRVERTGDGDVLEVGAATTEVCVLPRKVRYHGDPEADILGSALERSTHQGVLRGALRAACSLR
jgi:hypothetical protein